MKLDGYIRVSRVGGREGESYISKDVQRDTIQRWAKLRDAEIVAWHIDEDVSGGTLARPGLDALMHRVRSGQTGGVAVARLDRLSRAGVGEALKLVEEIYEQHGAKIAAVDLGIDPGTPFGEFAMTIMLGLARMERRRIKDGWLESQERAVARGVHVSSIPPTGYLRDATTSRLVPHPDYRKPVGDLFRLRAAGRSWKDLGDYLTAAGVVSAYGAGHWHGGSVQSILKNRAYLGEARSGSFVNADAHEPLIDRETWEAAQRVKGVRSPRSANPALLSGLVRCAACRYRMKSQWQPGRGDKPPLRTYRCGRNTSGGRCPSPGTISCHVLDAHVENAFFEAVGDLQAVPHVASVEVGALTDALRDAEREFNAFRDDQELTGILGREGFLDGLRARGARVDTARQALGEATEQVAVGELPDRATLEETWPTLRVEDKHRLLALVLDVVMVRSGRGVPVHERAAILLAGEAPDDLPARGVRAVPLRPFVWPVDRPDDARMALAE